MGEKHEDTGLHVDAKPGAQSLPAPVTSGDTWPSGLSVCVCSVGLSEYNEGGIYENIMRRKCFVTRPVLYRWWIGFSGFPALPQLLRDPILFIYLYFLKTFTYLWLFWVLVVACKIFLASRGIFCCNAQTLVVVHRLQ